MGAPFALGAFIAFVVLAKQVPTIVQLMTMNWDFNNFFGNATPAPGSTNGAGLMTLKGREGGTGTGLKQNISASTAGQGGSDPVGSFLTALHSSSGSSGASGVSTPAIHSIPVQQFSTGTSVG